MDVKITVDNREEVKRVLAEAVDRALEAAGLQSESYAKLELENAPRRIDTGLLRNSITHGLGGENPAILTYRGDRESKYTFNAGPGIPRGSYSGTFPADEDGKRTEYIGTNVNYAIYVHEGAELPSGGYMAPNHFLRNAIERNEETIKKLIKTQLEA